MNFVLSFFRSRLTMAAMSCWVHEELLSEWKRLVRQQVGAHTSGYDSPTVLLYWRLIDHLRSCEICRDDQARQKLLGKP